MSKKRVSTLRQRLAGLVAATAAIFLPTWAMSEQASAAIDETPTTSTTTTVAGQTEWTGAPLIPTIPPTIPTTTIRVPITFPPSPSTTAYTDPNPNAPEDCSDVNVEIKCSTTTTSTSTTTSTIPPTTTTSTIPVTTSTTSTTSTTVPPTTTSTITSTTTAAPTTLAPTTTAAPVVVTTTTPQPTLAVTGSSNSKPMAGAALIALAGGLGMVAFTEKRKLTATPVTAYSRPLGQATPTKTYRSSSDGVSPISSRSALTLVAPERTVNIPVIEVREITKPVVAVEAAPKMLELEAAPVIVSRDAYRLARAEAELLREFPSPVTIDLQDASSRLGFNAIAL